MAGRLSTYFKNQLKDFLEDPPVSLNPNLDSLRAAGALIATDQDPGDDNSLMFGSGGNGNTLGFINDPSANYVGRTRWYRANHEKLGLFEVDLEDGITDADGNPMGQYSLYTSNGQGSNIKRWDHNIGPGNQLWEFGSISPWSLGRDATPGEDIQMWLSAPAADDGVQIDWRDEGANRVYQSKLGGPNRWYRLRHAPSGSTLLFHAGSASDTLSASSGLSLNDNPLEDVQEAHLGIADLTTVTGTVDGAVRTDDGTNTASGRPEVSTWDLDASVWFTQQGDTI